MGSHCAAVAELPVPAAGLHSEGKPSEDHIHCHNIPSSDTDNLTIYPKAPHTTH